MLFELPNRISLLIDISESTAMISGTRLARLLIDRFGITAKTTPNVILIDQFDYDFKFMIEFYKEGFDFSGIIKGNLSLLARYGQINPFRFDAACMSKKSLYLFEDCDEVEPQHLFQVPNAVFVFKVGRIIPFIDMTGIRQCGSIFIEADRNLFSHRFISSLQLAGGKILLFNHLEN